ncbi:DUF3040 domain-containing protein [Nocardioides mesophilus]|uniref:DUF3040 domain-containing protein n=1 Tax=Nocardioides mesophilus TaxID=433659 RepID=A0A7G9RBX7_9ACTN|nr:DUF3040 domain-containing protein [Nocardioides mesophilus]QNN53102.1 DUF3040 domain-containing protein [Nocardioides mesophilus]
MPLSEEELRLLEQMEKALVAEDPKLASTMRGTTLRRHARRRAYIAAGAFVVGVAVLMTGAVLSNTYVGIVGFVLMLGSAYVALSSWRHQAAGPDAPDATDPHAPFTLIDGGRSRSRRRSPRGRSASSGGSFMERFEERWRRRRDQNGL